jgi:hypothetical protein
MHYLWYHFRLYLHLHGSLAAIPTISCTDSVSSSDNALIRALAAAPVGTTATVVCPPRCLASGEALDVSVYGCGNFYGFRSSVCKAAIHAGVFG